MQVKRNFMNELKILGKTFPNREQIAGRVKSKAFDGVEIFVMDDILENPGKYKEIAEFARNEFEIVNFETYFSVNTPFGVRMFGLIDPEKETRERSRALLEATIELADCRGNVNTHFVGIPSYVSPGKTTENRHGESEQIQLTGSFLRKFGSGKLTVENIIAFDAQQTPDVEIAALYNCGPDIVNFADLYQRFGIPMTFDVAHVAINLAHYKKQSEKGHLLVNGVNHRVLLSQNQRMLGTQTRRGITEEICSSLDSMPLGSIRAVHFVNARVDENDRYSDGYSTFNDDKLLLDLKKVLTHVKRRGDVRYVVAEVNEHVCVEDGKKPDYVSAPYMATMAKELRKTA